MNLCAYECAPGLEPRDAGRCRFPGNYEIKRGAARGRCMACGCSVEQWHTAYSEEIASSQRLYEEAQAAKRDFAKTPEYAALQDDTRRAAQEYRNKQLGGLPDPREAGRIGGHRD